MTGMERKAIPGASVYVPTISKRTKVVQPRELMSKGFWLGIGILWGIIVGSLAPVIALLILGLLFVGSQR